MAIILAGLAMAWFAIEVMHQVRVTIFQPFRMATMARGIAIIIIAGRLTALWRSDRPLGRIRAILLATGFLGDWLLVVVTSAELTVSVVEAIESRLAQSRLVRGVKVAAFLGVLAQGLNFLCHHDTESGNRPLLIALVVGVVGRAPGPLDRTGSASCGLGLGFDRPWASGDSHGGRMAHSRGRASGGNRFDGSSLGTESRPRWA